MLESVNLGQRKKRKGDVVGRFELLQILEGVVWSEGEVKIEQHNKKGSPTKWVR